MNYTVGLVFLLSLIFPSSLFGQDELGMMQGESRVERFVYDSNDSLISKRFETDDEVYAIDYTRDELGHVTTRIENANGTITVYDEHVEYDNLGRVLLQETSVNDKKLEVTRFLYGACDQPDKEEHHGISSLFVRNTFDSLCRLVQETRILNKETLTRAIQYDQYGQKTYERTVDGQVRTTTYRYAPNGSVTQRIDSINDRFHQAISYLYNDAEQLIYENTYHHIEGSATVANAYDDKGHLAERREQFYDPYESSIESWVYDAVGRLIVREEHNKWWSWRLELTRNEGSISATKTHTVDGVTTVHTGEFTYSNSGKLLYFAYR